MLASAFAGKLRQPGEGATEAPFASGHRGGEQRPLGVFRERTGGHRAPVTAVEINTAARALSSYKAPGPDMLFGIVYKKLPALAPMLRDLLNLVYGTST